MHNLSILSFILLFILSAGLNNAVAEEINSLDNPLHQTLRNCYTNNKVNGRMKMPLDTLDSNTNFPFYSNSNFHIEYIKNRGFTALNDRDAVLFYIYTYDNGPDYPSEGLFRIKTGNRIGYANLKGEIVIKPSFPFAYPFHRGLAAFLDEGKWGFIDKTGKVVIPAQYERVLRDFSNGNAEVEKNGISMIINRHGKPTILEASSCSEKLKSLAEQAVHISTKLSNSKEAKVSVDFFWKDSDESFTFSKENRKKILQITLLYGKDRMVLVRYLIIPWQNFSINTGNTGSMDSSNLLSMNKANTLLTVTDCAVIYIYYAESISAGTPENTFLQNFSASFKNVIKYDECSKTAENLELCIPEGVQVLSVKYFTYYIDIAIAVPGSILPEHSVWEKITSGRMLRLSFIPDIGEIRTIWVKPIHSEKNSSSTSSTLMQKQNETFPNYQIKRTPDTAKDFMPSAAEEIDNLPEAYPDNLESLISLFLKYKSAAGKNPGHWQDGNMILGAREKEYIPSEDEIMLSEIGSRLRRLTDSISKRKIKGFLQGKLAGLDKFEYTRFTFTHVDVMGSGRFFYVDTMSRESFILKDTP